MNVIPIPAYFNGIRTLADGTLRATIDTQELGEEGKMEIIRKVRKSGFFLFVENGEKVDTDNLNLPEVAPEFKGDKTPSQRLRGVLYRLWENIGGSRTFEEFYQIKMEEIVNHFKKQLE